MMKTALMMGLVGTFVFANGAEAAKEVPLLSVVKDRAYYRFPGEGLRILSGNEELSDVWTAMAMDRRIPPAPVPSVDFDKGDVLLYVGPVHHASRLEIVNVAKRRDALAIDVEIDLPGAGCPPPPPNIPPRHFHLVQIPLHGVEPGYSVNVSYKRIPCP